MTPLTLDQSLKGLPQDAPLVFFTDAGTIGSGYHVTEWKLAQINSIDCGGKTDAWVEASLQLLDEDGGAFMTVAKFRGILAASIKALPALAEAPFSVEFAHGNIGKSIFDAGTPELQGEQVRVHLRPAQAECKELSRWVGAMAGASGCAPDCC